MKPDKVIANPDIVNPDIANPDIVNPDIVNPDIVNPNVANPDIVNPDIVISGIVEQDYWHLQSYFSTIGPHKKFHGYFLHNIYNVFAS